MTWIADDIEQWRAILKYHHPEMEPMAKAAFLSAIDEIELLRKLLTEARAGVGGRPAPDPNTLPHEWE